MKNFLFLGALLSSVALAQMAPTTPVPSTPPQPAVTPAVPTASGPVIYAVGQTWKLESQDENGTLKELGTFVLEANPDAKAGSTLRAVADKDNRFFQYVAASEQVVFGFFNAANGQLGKDPGKFCVLPDGAAFQDLDPLSGLYYEGDAQGLAPVLDGSNLEKAGICQLSRVK